MNHPVIPIAVATVGRERKRRAPKGRRVDPDEGGASILPTVRRLQDARDAMGSGGRADERDFEAGILFGGEHGVRTAGGPHFQQLDGSEGEPVEVAFSAHVVAVEVEPRRRRGGPRRDAGDVERDLDPAPGPGHPDRGLVSLYPTSRNALPMQHLRQAHRCSSSDSRRPGLGSP